MFVTLFLIIDVCIKFCSYTVNIMWSFLVDTKKMDICLFTCMKHDGMMIYCDHCLEWYHWYVCTYMYMQSYRLYLAFRSCAKITEEPEAT